MDKKAKIGEKTAFPMDLKVVIAENLKRLIRRPGGRGPEDLLSDKEVEQRSGVSYKTVQRLRLPKESYNAPSLDSLYRLAHAFDIELWQILVRSARQPMVSGHERRIEQNQRSQRLIAEDSAMRNNHRKDRK